MQTLNLEKYFYFHHNENPEALANQGFRGKWG